ncbi:MAG: hypothetical protein LBC81_02305 [Tannerellaceae bacterium]|jgi:hypothetical protein|nr:hypothetical protein [Tannerellaceae bacterium]
MKEELIPRKIHWCWLSQDPLPKLVQDCINSWKRIMPDYEIITWDTNRFDIHSVKFVEQAYNARKWAFAADYIRLFALYTEGGIYLDSDIRVFRKFDRFLCHSAFSGIEYNPAWSNEQNDYTGYGIQAAVIGAAKGNLWIKDCMKYYIDRDFIAHSGKIIDVDGSPIVFAHYANTCYEFQYTNKSQLLKNNIVIYPLSTFATLWQEVNLYTYAIHLCEQAWIDKAVAKRAAENRVTKLYRKLCSTNRLFAMTHYWRKRFFYHSVILK